MKSNLIRLVVISLLAPTALLIYAYFSLQAPAINIVPDSPHAEEIDSISASIHKTTADALTTANNNDNSGNQVKRGKI